MKCVQPSPSRMKVKKTNGVDREVVQITQVFGNDDFPVWLRHSRELLEKQNAFARLYPDFVRGKKAKVVSKERSASGSFSVETEIVPSSGGKAFSRSLDGNFRVFFWVVIANGKLHYGASF